MMLWSSGISGRYAAGWSREGCVDGHPKTQSPEVDLEVLHLDNKSLVSGFTEFSQIPQMS